MGDVRAMARALVEKSGDVHENWKLFLATFPEKLGHRYEEVHSLFKNGDIAAYNHQNVWYHILKKHSKYKDP